MDGASYTSTKILGSHHDNHESMMMVDSMMSPTQYLDDVLEGNESEEEDLYTDDEEEEVISKEYAILSWLQTFPRVQNVLVDVKAAIANNWYEKESTMR